jgi:hypothetical protein
MPVKGNKQNCGAQHGCSGINGQEAGRRYHEQQWSADLSMSSAASSRRQSWKIACPSPETTAARHANRRFNSQNCQIVAGLWLKYGAKPLNIESSWRF